MVWGDVVRPLEPGSVAMVTQSGNVGVNALGSRRGMRWHTVVSTGNQTVCDASDWLAALAERDGVRSVALFLESDDDGAKLGEALALCAERSIGVAVLKVGASEAGARAASAHTGSLAGDQRVFRALIEEAGGAWAEDFHDLLELAKALAEPRARPRGDGGLAVLTCSGGDSGVAGDQAAALGLDLPPLSLATARRLAELLPAAATIANPLDYTAMIWDDTDSLREIVAVVGGDPAIDQLLLLLRPPRGRRTSLGPGPRRASSAAPTSPAPRRSSPPPFPTCSTRERRSSSPPAACPRSPACARRCLRARATRGRSRTRPGCARSPRRRARAATAGGHGGSDEAATKELLRAGGVAVPDGATATDADAAVAVAERIGWPVALKLSGPEIRHKSEAGALALGIADERALRDACDRLRRAQRPRVATAPGRAHGRARAELLVAARADAVVPAWWSGSGGSGPSPSTTSPSSRCRPSAARVEAALRSLRGGAVLTGGRGRQALAVGAVAELAARAGELLLERGLSLLELNPWSPARRRGRARRPRAAELGAQSARALTL